MRGLERARGRLFRPSSQEAETTEASRGAAMPTLQGSARRPLRRPPEPAEAVAGHQEAPVKL